MALRTDSMPIESKSQMPKGERRIDEDGRGYFYEYKKGRDDEIIAKLKKEYGIEEPKEIKAELKEVISKPESSPKNVKRKSKKWRL